MEVVRNSKASPLKTTEDEDVFEIIDYTAASPLERLVSSIEEVLMEWGVEQGKMGPFTEAGTSNDSHIDVHTIEFVPIPFVMTFHHLPQSAIFNKSSYGEDSESHKGDNMDGSQSEEYLDPADVLKTAFQHGLQKLGQFYVYNGCSVNTLSKSDRLPDGYYSPLHRWTGLTHFISFCGRSKHSTTTDSDDAPNSKRSWSHTTDINTCKLISSAFAIALGNCSCKIPVFIQTGPSWKLLYNGVSILKSPSSHGVHGFESNGMVDVEQRFKMAFLSYIPPEHETLASLCVIFKERLGLVSPKDGLVPKVLDDDIFTTVSTRYVHHVNSMDSTDWDRVLRRFHPINPIPLRMGVLKDPIDTIVLETHFPLAPSESYIGFMIDPMSTPSWYLRFSYAVQKDHPPLCRMVKNTISIWLQLNASKSSNSLVSNDSVLSAAPNTSPTADRQKQHSPKHHLVDQHDVMDAISFLMFGSDSLRKSSSGLLTPSRSSFESINESSTTQIKSTTDLMAQMRYQSVTVPMDSILWRLAIRITDACSTTPKFLRFDAGGVALLKGVWSEFIAELTSLWDLGLYLPCVDIRVPDSKEGYLPDQVDIDMSSCLLHQKLAMLNCCVFRKTGLYPSPENMDMMLEKVKSKMHKLPRSLSPSLYAEATNDSRSQSSEKKQSLNPSKSEQSGYIIDKLADFVAPSVRNSSSSTNEKPVASSNNPLDLKSQSSNSLSDLHLNKGDSIKLVRTTSIGRSIPSTNIANEPKTSVCIEGTSWTSDKSWENFPSNADSKSLNYTPEVGNGGKLVGGKHDAANESLDDSFVEINESMGNPLKKDLDTEQAVRSNIGDDEWDGRLKILDNLKISKTNEAMWEPKTQHPGYMTEDMVRDQAQIMESLGTTEDGAKLRARMQCSQLISDMEAFKAANPHAALQDFVRWHSPRDWIEESDGTGRLSDRMIEPGNLWQECWEVSLFTCSQLQGARRVPVSRQKPLFDCEKEAIKAIYYLESATPQDILKELLPTLFLIVYEKFATHELARMLPTVSKELEDFGNHIVSIRWNNINENDLSDIESMLQRIQQIELHLCIGMSLLQKIPRKYALIDRLIAKRHAFVNQNERDTVHDLFLQGEATFPFPTMREFILQNIKLTGSEDRGLLMRMYCHIMEGDFRIVETTTCETRWY